MRLRVPSMGRPHRTCTMYAPPAPSLPPSLSPPPRQAGLTAALWRWHRSICALRRADTESLSTSAAASNHSALQLLGRRLVSAANVVRPATASTASTASTVATLATRSPSFP